MHSSTSAVFPEVDAMETLLSYKTSNAGCCKILLHPEWGSYVYPASMFTTAPIAAVKAAIEAATDDSVELASVTEKPV